MKAYIDSDVILDVLLAREAHLHASSQILDRCETGIIRGCTTALAIANIYYILRCYDATRAKRAIQSIRAILTVLPVSDREIELALQAPFKDFEDGVQNFVAEAHHCRWILTRNKKDYAGSALKVLTPNEYLLIGSSRSP